MKKIILIFILLFVIAEIAAWYVLIHSTKKYYPERIGGTGQIVSPFKWRPVKHFEDYYPKINLRPTEGTQYKKSPIVIFGCSFAHGDELNENQTLSYKLSKYIKVPVYNKAFSGWGLQQMLWQLQNDKSLDSIKEPEFVIYVFIDDHIKRLQQYGQHYTDFLLFQPNNIYEYLRYRESKGKLTIWHDSFPIFRHTALATLIMDWWDNKIWERLNNQETRDKFINLMKLHFLESKKIVNQKWPNAKFIIFDYESWYDKVPESQFNNLWKELEKDGFIYIYSRRDFNVGSSDLKYRVYDKDPHPNELAWDTIVPQLSKKLKELK